MSESTTERGSRATKVGVVTSDKMAKSVTVRRVRIQVNVDAYNALNANSIRALSSTFGSGGRASSAWQRPTQILDPRLIQVGGQISF